MSTRQDQFRLIFFLVLIGMILAVRLGITKVGETVAHKAAVSSPNPAPTPPGDIPPQAPEEQLAGESILERYGDPSTTPEEDLVWMSRAIGNFALLVKGPQPLPMGANEEVALALQGKNSVHLRYLPKDHPAFNAKGQIVDRWGTPLFFHASSSDRLDIRSAGPDKQMWTEDDLHRKHDGRFLKGEALLAPSLLDETSKVK